MSALYQLSEFVYVLMAGESGDGQSRCYIFWLHHNDYIITMNIIYHRNCLDGVFASYVIYMLSRVVSEEDLMKF
jgi:NAD dependent epimerase/dehydratase family enzyme